MRIISGKLGGKEIRLPKFFKDRPTTDYAKEALFNILSNWYDFEGLKVLDLFAGSGSISYEFASRGVESITIVDKNPRYLSFIKQTFRNYFPELEGKVMIVQDDVRSFLKERELDYDIIFADPPYALSWLEQIPELLFENETVRDDTLFILEHPKKYDFSSHPYFFRHKKYGEVNFSFFEKDVK